MTAVGSVISGFAENIGNALESVTNMFYVSGTSGGAGHLTTLGVLLVIAIGTGLVFWSFGLIKSLIRRA